MPKVSVILPVYNCENFIFDTIQSILNQTFSDFELLIIDDCSTDSTVSVINKFIDTRIVLIIKEKNTGYTDSLNYAVSIAKGSYIARMDGDDICLPERFEKQVAFLDVNSNIGLCGTAIKILDSENHYLNYPLHHEEIKVRLCVGTSFCHPSIMGRREVFVENPYNSEMEPAEDVDLWMRLVEKEQLANLEEVLLLYRKHENQISNTKNRVQQENSFLCKLSLFREFNLLEHFSLDQLKFVLMDRLPCSIGDCEVAVSFFNYVMIQNHQIKFFNEHYFNEKMEEQKIKVFKKYFTRDRFLKMESIKFFFKFTSLSVFFKILNLSKRIQILFNLKPSLCTCFK